MNKNLRPYLTALEHWLPGARLAAEPPPTPVGQRARPDLMLHATIQGHTLAFALEHKPHVATQDIRFVMAQLADRLAAPQGPASPKAHALLVAPYIRAEQAAGLRAAGINYLDLAGNAHLKGPGLFVHVEGRKPETTAVAGPGRLTRGWVKTVFALLVRADLRTGPYRPIAAFAGVSLGTVNACMKDLEARGHLDVRTGGRALTGVPDLLALWVQTYADVLRPKLRVRYFEMREQQTR